MASAWHWVSIGIADMEVALDFWVGRLGFECVARAEGMTRVFANTGAYRIAR